MQQVCCENKLIKGERILWYLPTPSLWQDMTQGQFCKRSLTGLNSEFSFSKTSRLTKAEELSLSYYLPIAGGWIIRFIPFPRVLGLCEMQSVSSRIWTRVAVSISYDDNHYTTRTRTKLWTADKYASSKWLFLCSNFFTHGLVCTIDIMIYFLPCYTRYVDCRKNHLLVHVYTANFSYEGLEKVFLISE